MTIIGNTGLTLSAGSDSLHWGTTAPSSGVLFVPNLSEHTIAESAGLPADASQTKPDTPEQWLRGRVKEICDLAKAA